MSKISLKRVSRIPVTTVKQQSSLLSSPSRIRVNPKASRTLLSTPKRQEKPRVVSKVRSIKAPRKNLVALRPRNQNSKKIAATTAPENIRRIDEIKGSGQGKVLIIIGNGPSHKEVDLPAIAQHPLVDTMSINKPDKRIWPTDYWLFCDNSQYRRHVDLWNNYNNVIINSSAVQQNKSNVIKIRTLSGDKFSTDIRSGFYIGRSSVYAAMQAALWMNYNKIYIFGVDMCAVDGKLYPWGSNPDVKDAARIKRFDVEAKYYDKASKTLSDHKRNKFLFCTKYNPYPFVKKFGRIDHNDAVKTILDYVKELENGKK